MRVPKQKHNASSKQTPQHSVVGKSGTQPGKSPQQSALVQTLSRVGNAGNHAALLNRAPGSQQPANKNLLLHLQRQHGNSYVNQVVKQAQQNDSASTQQAPIQTKLTIGPVGDKYEREADRTAAAVVQRINAPTAVQSAVGQAIQREKMPEEVQKKPQITAIQREKMPGEDEEKQAQMKPAVELLQTKKPEEEDKLKQVAKKTALSAPHQPKKIEEEDKKKALRKQAESNPSKAKKQEEDDKLKHLQKKSDAHAEHGHKEEEEDKLPVQKKSHPDAGSTKKPEEEDKLKHLQKKSDTHAEHGHKEEEEDKLPVQKKSQPDATPHEKPEEDDDKHLMQAKSDVGVGHGDKDEEDKMAQMQPLVQRRSGEGGTDATADVESSIKHARGKGRPLPDHVRGSMENAFGADFSGVKIHADTHADNLNRSIQARAFTTGQDVFFRQGEFAFGSKRGQELLAHELTHVVQQNGNAVQPKSLPKQEKKENKLQSKTKFNQSAEPAAIPEQKAHAGSTHLVPTAAPADTSGQGDVQQQLLEPEARIGEIEVQRQEAAGDAAPNSPEADPGYQEVVSQAQGVGTKQKEHQPAEEKSQEAQDAAEPPSNEVESKAQDKQVDAMEIAPTPPFDAKAFKEALMKRIADITPKNLEEADKFKDSNKLESVKNDVTGKVDTAQKDSQGPLEEKTKATPDTSGITPKPVTPLPANQPGETPSINGAEKAAPKSKGQSQVEAPAQARSQSLDQQLAGADITEEQLAKSNEPQFQSALDSKKTAQTHSQTAPQAYRQGEQSQLSQAESAAAGTAQEKLQGMHGERSQSLEQVTGKQEEGKGKDEESRTKIAGDIDKIYQTTKTKVDTKLAKLTTDVESEFGKGAAAAKKGFEDYVSKRMDAYKAERYSGFWGPGKWAWDKLFGMPDEVNRFYEEGRDLYIKDMDGVIDRVVTIVGTGLTEAKNDVAEGRKQVKDYVAKLPEDLKAIGEEAATNIQSQFDGLEQDIQSKQDELIDTLAQKYKENLDAIDARIKEMQEENKGLIQKAIDFIVGVIETIVELAKMLLEVLARVASVIGSILKDPIGFLGNLFNALKLGFNNFVKNIGKHLMQGLLSWLTGTLAGANIQMPTSLDSQGIFSLVIQVLGVGYDAIRARAVKRMGKDGEEKVSHLEKSFEMFRILATQGVAGVWQVLKDRLGDFKSMVLDPIMQFLIENVISAGVQWIIGLMSPASAFIKACKAIYDIVKFFIEHAQQIADLINSILDAIALVASGAIDKAAQAVEDSLAKAIPVAIGFLASILGLGNISAKVQSIIQKMRQPIDKAIDWVIDQAVKAYKVVEQKIQKTKLAKKAKAAKEAARKKKEAAQKLINKKKEAVEKRYEKEKNKLPKSKAGKKQLDALKKKRDAVKKKFDAAKKWPAKKLEAFMGRKDKKQRGIGKDKAGSKKDTQKTNKRDHKRLAKLAVMELEKTDRKPKDYKSLRAEKQVQAKQIEKSYTQKLEKGIKLTVRFEDAAKDEKDGKIDFKVVIAPNQTEEEGKIQAENEGTLLNNIDFTKVKVNRKERNEFQDNNSQLSKIQFTIRAISLRDEGRETSINNLREDYVNGLTAGQYKWYEFLDKKTAKIKARNDFFVSGGGIIFKNQNIENIVKAIAIRSLILNEEPAPRSGKARAAEDIEKGKERKPHIVEAIYDKPTKALYKDIKTDPVSKYHNFTAKDLDDKLEAKIVHTGSWSKGERKPSQGDVMGGQNAKNYVLDNHPDVQKKMRYIKSITPDDKEAARNKIGRRYEWLHIIGSSLGGQNTANNLVAGTYDANTKMIALEHRIAQWNESKDEGESKPQNKQIKIEGVAKVYKGTHVGKELELKVKHGNTQLVTGNYNLEDTTVITKSEYEEEEKRVKQAIETSRNKASGKERKDPLDVVVGAYKRSRIEPTEDMDVDSD